MSSLSQISWSEGYALRTFVLLPDRSTPAADSFNPVELITPFHCLFALRTRLSFPYTRTKLHCCPNTQATDLTHSLALVALPEPYHTLHSTFSTSTPLLF